VTLAACVLGCGPVSWGASLAELKADHDLTPERLLKYFAPFRFQAGRSVRSPEEFLQRQCGDCDDFATLAAELLRERGYQTRLVAVFMPSEVHVVCYVAEIGGYLDFNRRREPAPIVKCDHELPAIAASVAHSFGHDWTSVSEYKFRNGSADFVLTAFH